MRRSSLPIAEPAIRLIWCEDYNQLCGVRVILGGAWLCSHSVRHLKRPRATTDQDAVVISPATILPLGQLLLDNKRRSSSLRRSTHFGRSQSWHGLSQVLVGLVIANSPRLATPCTAHLQDG